MNLSGIRFTTFVLSSLVIGCLSAYSVPSFAKKVVAHKPKIASTHFVAQAKDCYTAPDNCLIAVTPSPWQQGKREYNIEQTCDYEDAQMMYLHELPLKDQIAERKFLGNKFCNGVVTISDMALPFSKNNSKMQDANDGILFVDTVKQGMIDINNQLIQMTQLATQAGSGVYSSTQLANMDTEFQAYLNEVNRIANTTNFNGMSLLDGSATTVSIPIHNGKSFIPINLINATTGYNGLNIDSLDIRTLSNAQSTLDLILQAENKVATGINLLENIRPELENAAKIDATVTTVDLSDVKFVVHQEAPVGVS